MEFSLFGKPIAQVIQDIIYENICSCYINNKLTYHVFV